MVSWSACNDDVPGSKLGGVTSRDNTLFYLLILVVRHGEQNKTPHNVHKKT